VFVDPNNNVYVSANHKILKYANANTAGASTTTIGAGTVGYLDGASNVAKFYWPSGMDMDKNENLFVADEYNNRIRMITPGLVVSTLAGSGIAGGANGAGTSATFNKPRYLTLSPDKSDLYVSDYQGHRLRKIKVCQPGSYFNSATSSCSACPANTFNSKTGSIGASACQSCPTGYTANPGSSSCAIVECFWVVESWKKMGRTSVSSTSATDCCNYVVSSTGTTTTQTYGLPKVKCTSTGIVTQINWWDRNLENSIPAELGRLTSLTYL
jgi:hypothetical protein